jgi:hypothetical protein
MVELVVNMLEGRCWMVETRGQQKDGLAMAVILLMVVMGET